MTRKTARHELTTNLIKQKELNDARSYALRPARCAFRRARGPTLIRPTDAIIRMRVTCVCGSDLWDYRGINPITQPKPMGHEYCGIGGEVGREVTSIKPGQFVIGSFFASDNTCPNCEVGYQSSCQHREFVGTAQAPRCYAFHSRMAPWWQPRIFPPTIWSRISWRSLML